MPAYIKLFASRQEADVDGFFLANKQAATLGTAVARFKTDLHLSGNTTATPCFLTAKDTEVTIKLPDSCNVVPGKVKIPASLRMNVTASRIGLGIAGDVGRTLSGQGSIVLKSIVDASQKMRSATTSCTYSSWANIGAYVAFSNAKFFDSQLNNELKPEFVEQGEDAAATMEASETVLQSMYDNATKLRSIVVYKPAPPLSKPVMKVPVGINGSTYDISCNVVDRPPSLSRGAFEEMIKACMTMEFGMDLKKLAQFMAETKAPSVQASTWSEHVANAMSTMICFTIPYRLDGATTVSPTGLQMVQAEFWKAEPQRDISHMDDCEGSGSEIASFLYASEDVARDADLAQKYPVTAAISNALVHHAVGLCVLAANAGSADSAGKHGHANIAGHAIALAVPKASLLKGKIIAMIASGGYGNAVSESQMKLIESVKSPFCKALYNDMDTKRMPDKEQTMLKDADYVMDKFLSDNSHIIPLAMEGTSPVTSTKLHEADVPERLAQVSMYMAEKQLSAAIGPTLARSFSRLHIPPTTSGPPHAFYKDFVEFLLPARRSGTFKSAELRSLNQAACHYVLASSHDVLDAGVNTVDMHAGDFSIMPLYKLGTEEAEIMDVAIKQSLADTMTMRPEPCTMDEHESAVYAKNIQTLRDLSVAKPANNVSDLTELRQILTMTATMHNENGIAHLATVLKNDSNVRAVNVNMVQVDNVLINASGEDVGILVELRVYG